jgi:hypothetical protein
MYACVYLSGRPRVDTLILDGADHAVSQESEAEKLVAAVEAFVRSVL